MEITELPPELDPIKSAFEKTIRDISDAIDEDEFTAELADNIGHYDIVINAGYPPAIFVNRLFVLRCAINKTRALYRKAIADAIIKSKKMHRTLRHPVPLAQVIAWREENRKWFKSNDNKIIRLIPDSYFSVEVIHTVRVTESITGTSVSLSGNDISKLVSQAKSRLTNLVSGDDRIHDVLDMNSHVAMQIPSSVSMSVSDNTIHSEYKYE